ncbi:MAG: M28 family peptidase [Planctomycetota bacterium]
MLTAALLALAGSLGATSDSTNLERALDTISADEIRSDLEFIASDPMKGRDTPSPQLQIAARFLRARLMRLGLTPGGQGGSYFYEWTFPQVGMDLEATSLRIEGRKGVAIDLEWGKDYYLPQTALARREVEGAAIWAGKFDRKKVGKLKVKGRWLVGVNEDGISQKLRRDLQEKGAAGVLLFPPKRAKKTVDEIFGQLTAGITKPRLARGVSERERLPVVHVDEAAAQRILEVLPQRLSIGADLDVDITERCGFGRLDDAVLENVVGIWPGSDPRLKKELIIISAHYDHIGWQEDGTVFNGADDNGSGTCGLLAIAEALVEYGPMRRSVMLMWVSGEEKGLYGSEAWTKDPYLPNGLKPLCNINIDMIGRNKSDEFLITPTSKHSAYNALTKVAEANMRKEGFRKVRSADSYWRRSDHANFSEHLDIPVAFLFCDVHEDYHKATDTPDKIDYDKVRRICRLVVRMLEALQIDEPKF